MGVVPPPSPWRSRFSPSPCVPSLTGHFTSIPNLLEDGNVVGSMQGPRGPDARAPRRERRRRRRRLRAVLGVAAPPEAGFVAPQRCPAEPLLRAPQHVEAPC